MSENTGFAIVGRNNVDNARLLMLRSALKLELRGIKMVRGRSVFAIVKSEFQLKGNKQKVFDQFNKIVTDTTGV